MENTENIENIEKDSKKELEDSIRNIFKEVSAEFVKAKEVAEPKIEIVSDNESLKNSFNKFLADVALEKIKPEFNAIQNNVTIEIPKQYSPLIVPVVGSFGQLGNCFRVGDLVSDVLTIERSVSAGSTNWITKTQRSTNSLTGAISANSINVGMGILDCWTTLYNYQLFSGGYDAQAFVNKNVNRQMPLAVDTQIFAGTGSPFTGIYGDAYVQTVTLGGPVNAITGLSLTSTRAMVAKIDPAFRTNDLKWYVDITEEQNLLALADTNNTYEQIVNGYGRHLGFEIVPMSSGVLNTTSTSSAKHFILANLKEAIQYADRPMALEVYKTTGNAYDYRFYQTLALGCANPKASVVAINAAS